MINQKVFKYDEKTELLVKGYIDFRGKFFAESSMYIPKQYLAAVSDVLWPHVMEASNINKTNELQLVNS